MTSEKRGAAGGCLHHLCIFIRFRGSCDVNAIASLRVLHSKVKLVWVALLGLAPQNLQDVESTGIRSVR